MNKTGLEKNYFEKHKILLIMLFFSYITHSEEAFKWKICLLLMSRGNFRKYFLRVVKEFCILKLYIFEGTNVEIVNALIFGIKATVF